MTELRINTSVRRMRTLKVYHLEPSVSVVPCLSSGIAKEGSFSVYLTLSENNKEKKPYSAYIRYRRCSAGSCSAPIVSKGKVSSVSVDTGKSAGAVFDSYVIEAYEKTTAADKILAVVTVSTVRDGIQGSVGPMLVPNGSWDSKRIYRSAESYRIFVERNKLYFVLHKLNVDCLNVDPALDVKNEYWRLMDYVEYMFVNAMVANFGKIASTVFTGDYTISQHGVSKGIDPASGLPYDYKDFTPDMSKFEPNIVIDWLTGSFRGRAVEILGNSRFGGQLDGVSGTFAELSCKDNAGRRMVISPSGDGTSMPSLAFYDQHGCKVFNMSVLDDGRLRGTSLELTAYNSDNQETNYCLVHSNGFLKCAQPNASVTLDPKGITFNKVVNGIEQVGLTYPSERKVLVCTGGTYNVVDEEFVRSKSGTNYINLPPAANNAGRTIFVKKTSGGDHTYLKSKGGGIIDENNSSSVSEYSITTNVALMVKSDGSDWCVFYCG